MILRLALLAVVLGVAPAAHAQCASERVKQLYDESEAERADRSDSTTSVLKRDEKRLKEMLKLDKKGELCTPEDKWMAAWVILNSDDVDDIERAYELAQEAMGERHPRGPWLVGFAFDRWRVSRGFMQAYGTQTAAKGSVRCLLTVDPEITDAQRATYQQPTLAETYRRLLDLHGFTEDDATFDRMERRGLTCEPEPWDGTKRVAAPPG